MKIKKISASLDLLSIFAGRIAISSLLIEKPVLEIDLDPYFKSSGPSEPLPIRAFFEWLNKVPLSQLGLKEAELKLSSHQWQGSLQLSATDLLVINRQNRLMLQFDFNDSLLNYRDSKDIPFRLQGEAILSAETLDISNLKLATLNSFMTLKGSLTNFPRIHIKPEGALEFEVFSDLALTSVTAKQFFKFPVLEGSVKTSGRFELNKQNQATAGFKFHGQKIKIDQFDLGDIQFEGKFADQRLKISDIALTNESGLIDIKNLEMDLEQKEGKTALSVAGQVITDQVDLNELLIRLGIGDIPLELFLSADLRCQGPLLPQLLLNCQGKVNSEQLEVRTGDKVKDVIVHVDEIAASGEFTITEKNISYQAQLQVKEDHGTSEGIISYRDGFNIKYATPNLHLKNIRNLAGLKLEGQSGIVGSTSGDSNAAVIQMNLSPKDFVFEDFKLGQLSGNMNYEKGTLHFSDIQGQIGNPETQTTQYVAQVDVDLRRKRVSAQGQIPQFEINQLLSVFDRRFQMPVEVSGSGTASVQVEGPFELGKLSYDLNAHVSRGSVAAETFDRVEVSLHSEAGEAVIRKAQLTKNKSEINLTGRGHPDGQIDLRILAKQFPLEDSDHISKLGSQISGLVDLDMSLIGFILTPDTKLKGRLYQLVVEELDFPDSTFALNIERQSFSGNTNLFAGQFRSDFLIPLADHLPFKLNVKAKDWNYTALFALLGAGTLLHDYQAAMTADLNLESAKGGFGASSGYGTIQNLLLQRGSLALKNPTPMTLDVKNGIGSLGNFRLTNLSAGDQTFFEVKGKDFSKDDLKLKIDGQANLRLFQIFLPFLEELSGQSTLAVNTSGPLLKPEILGSAKVQGAFVKIKGFPHPFEKIQSDIQFSQSRILVNALKGTLAGGTFEGEGSLLIEGPRDLPVNIKAHLSNVNLNVPDRIRTSGDADLVFSGNWFPFTLSGTYHVQGGLIEKEFGDEAGTNNLKQSSYLPKAVLQSAFEPILLDLNILLEKPLNIKDSLLDGSLSGHMTVRGPPTQPILGGRIATEKGSKIMFRDKVFEIQTANIQFTESDEINPDIYISATSRIADYDVNLLVLGNAKAPVPRMTSVPPLSEGDIASLIALGVTSQKLERQVENNNKNTSGENLKGVVGGVISQSPLFRKAQEATGLELRVTPSYDDNVSVQRITLSKKLSDRIRASATQVTGNRSAKEFSIQYNLTQSVSAIGRYEDRQPSENSSIIDKTSNENQSILGIDLEFKKEFK